MSEMEKEPAPQRNQLKRVVLWNLTLALAVAILWGAGELHDAWMARIAGPTFEKVGEMIGKDADTNGEHTKQ